MIKIDSLAPILFVMTLQTLLAELLLMRVLVAVVAGGFIALLFCLTSMAAIAA